MSMDSVMGVATKESYDSLPGALSPDLGQLRLPSTRWTLLIFLSSKSCGAQFPKHNWRRVTGEPEP